MIEALLLIITVYAIVLLAFEINRVQDKSKEKTLGFFSYVDENNNADLKPAKKNNSNA